MASLFVFVSASHKDDEWRQRLRAKLDAHSPPIPWWDDSRLTPGSRWEAEIDAAIDRASVAVVLLSPNYLSSDTATNELMKLGERARLGRLTLFPILLFPCAWSQFNFLREIQIWSAARPIGELDAETADREFQSVADAIAAAGTSPDVHPGLRFSKTATETLKRARSLADQSGRDGVTSSCLLFALADRAGSVEDTARWVRNQLDSTGRYDAAFGAFLSDSATGPRQSAAYGGEVLGRVSRNVSDLLKRSQEIARRASSSKEIHQRHLFAALLTTPDSDTGVRQVARSRLQQLGIDLTVLLGKFRKFTLALAGDNQAEWDAILTTVAAPQPGPERRLSVDEPPRSDGIALGALLRSADLMTDTAKSAFRRAAALALKRGKPVANVDLLQSYLLEGSLDEANDVGAFTAIVWACLPPELRQTPSDRHAQVWQAFGLDSEMVRSTEKTLDPDNAFASPELVALVTKGRDLAQMVQDGVASRHFLICLIEQPGELPDTSALLELLRRNVDVPKVRAMYRDWLAKKTNDSPERLDSALGITAERAAGRFDLGLGTQASKGPSSSRASNAFVPGTAGYSSEFCGVGGSRPVPDHLGVDAMAHRLAELIALRETKLPLAVGLFGNWGSGKSHFMNLMDRQLKTLMAEDKKRLPGTPSKWCGEIVPIYFNAWHYIDTNLWASLISQIFESLFDHLSPKQGNELANVQELLEKASGATARAAEEMRVAHSATEHAKVDVTLAEMSRRREETVVNGLLNGLRSLLPDVTPAKLKQEVVSLLGVQKEMDNIEDLREVVDEAGSLSGRLRTAWNALSKRPGRGWRLAWLGAVAAVTAVAPSVVERVYPPVQGWLDHGGRLIAHALAFLPSFVLWLRPVVAEVRRRVRQLEEWERRAESARQDAAETPAVMEARANFTTATAREESTKSALVEALARERQLRGQAANLAPQRRLGRFIEQRAQSSDYRGHLGLVSLARRDFQELSDLFTDDVALNDRVNKLNATGDPEKQSEADELKTLSKSIDRIVLFVDDLDRCQPEKVVDVLQAMHLLLAFPLFAVVVGVDQRCLRQSLRMQFKGLLTPEPQPDAAHAEPSSLDNDERPATPLDYLEKIFHIPFHLPAMEQRAFGTLMEKLSEPPAADSPSPPGNKTRNDVPRATRTGLAETPNPRETTNVPAVERNSDPATVSAPTAGITQTDRSQPREAMAALLTSSSAAPQTVQLVGSVPLLDWERQALKDYHLLIRTPRGATRFLNTYRLLRASIPSEEWDAFGGDEGKQGESRVVMLLLAAAAGHPAVAREWFEVLRNSDAALRPGDVKNRANLPGWSQFQQAYDATFNQAATQPTKQQFVKWLDRVEQFTF